MVCMLATLALGVWPGFAQVHELKSQRQEFPIVASENRLLHERHNRHLSSKQPRVLNASLYVRLNDLESNLDKGGNRNAQLKRLHDHQHELFGRARGF